MPYFLNRRNPFRFSFKENAMRRIVNFAVLATFVTLLSACATQPQPAPDNYTPPARKLDAKTQLETGRR